MDQATAQVECYSGGEYAERPRALYWQGMRLEIAEILASWRTPSGKRFQVCIQDGRVFELAYSFETDAWTIVQK